MRKTGMIAVLIWMTSCGAPRPTPGLIPGIAHPLQPADTGLLQYKRQIRGQWYTRDAGVRTTFSDSLCIHVSASGTDTVNYKLYTDHSGTTDQETLIYLSFISATGMTSRFSIETLTDSSLVLMSLENGNIWSLIRATQ